MKTLVGLFGLGLLVLGMLAAYRWALGQVGVLAAALQPWITDPVRDQAINVLAGLCLVYAFGAMTLVVKALNGTLRGASWLSLAMGLSGLALAMGWFVLWTSDGGMMGPRPMLLCLGVLCAVIPGTLLTLSALFNLAFAIWYAPDARKALRHASMVGRLP